MKQYLVAFFLSVLPLVAYAQEPVWGGLYIEEAYIRATPHGAPVGAAFMRIINRGDNADRLIAAEAKFSKITQVHSMTVVDNIMRMQEVDGGLEIKSGEEVTLKPGGYHIMFMGLEEQMLEGEIRTVILHFKDAGAMRLELPVKALKMQMKQK